MVAILVCSLTRLTAYPRAVINEYGASDECTVAKNIKYGVLVEIKVLGENLTSVTLSAINSIWNALRQNPGLCGKKPASNNLKCVIVYTISHVVI